MKRPLTALAAYGLLIALLPSCQKEPETLMRLVPSAHSGIEFVNTIIESDTFNILTEEYIYNGGGVAVADFNNDGLNDIFFTGNMVSNRLYLNRGDLRFEDVTNQANLVTKNVWCSGVAVADLNGDGWTDLYVCTTMLTDPEKRRNLLYINQGIDENGIPTFKEEAAAWGLDDTGYAMMAGFFDYDRDGDLDVYILINQRLTGVPTNYRKKMEDGTSPNNDKLYRNNGDGTFTDVSSQAGITIEGFGLGLAISDFNNDGWPDAYISNDFLSNDILYINNGDGTFANHSRRYIGHQSQFSMGNDAADVNNDGLTDIITLDMLPETNYRKKTTIGGMSYQTYINNEKFGYEYQYVRNMLHLNQGLDAGIGFSETGQLSGMYQTEWSWSPLLADFDNDGYRDLIVTNGFPRDVTDKDFAKYRAAMGSIATPALLVDSIPIIHITNYAFRNNGDLTFTDVSANWGFTDPSFSNGAAFADLDNDGDLDYVVNNINERAFLYENTLYTTRNRPDSVHYLRIRLMGYPSNSDGLGAKVTLSAGGNRQYHDQNLYRGYLSTVERAIHFGLGKAAVVDSLYVVWPDGKGQILTGIAADQLITVSYDDAIDLSMPGKNSRPAWLREVSHERGLVYLHEEEDKIDFNYQRTLPRKFSQSGPGLAVGDVNRDGLDDLVIGGSSGYGTTLFLQTARGTFTRASGAFPDLNKLHEDEGLLLFDADGDGDLDLYAVSGSMEFPTSALQYQDRLYLNNGKGKFSLAQDALPELTGSGSCVRAVDFDGDGDLDLFVGGRVATMRYPYPGNSYLLRNDGGKFTDVTTSVCPELGEAGMILDALWSDVDGNGHPDLVVAGEFMPLNVFSNDGQNLKRVAPSVLDQYSGWWNSLAAGDFDGDGDIDFIAGNYGLNNSYCATPEYPLEVFANDFDGNGSIDPILACHLPESFEQPARKLFPVHFWDELISQSPKFRQQFSSYDQYGRTSMDELLSAEDMSGGLRLTANFMQSSYIENLGDFNFRVSPLPVEAQVAPVNGLVVEDVNGDGHTDVLVVGNDYGNEVFVGRMDALKGLVLLGDGKGHFTSVTPASSGFHVGGDGKALASLVTGDGAQLFIATQNRDSLRVFQRVQKDNAQWFTPGLADVRVIFEFADGKKQVQELVYGAGYLSQSTRKVRIPDGIVKLTVVDSRGNTRQVDQSLAAKSASRK